MSKTYNDFLRDLGAQESSSNYDTINSAHFIGKYQFGKGSLIDIGFIARDSTPNTNNWQSAVWTGLDDIHSKDDFLKGPYAKIAQEDAINRLMKLNYSRLHSIYQYVGQTLNGIKITLSGLLAGAHLVGAKGESDYIASGEKIAQPHDGSKVPVTVDSYIKRFADYSTPFSIDHNQPSVINGTTRNDIIIGGSGNDTIDGGGGADTLEGGGGQDIFIFKSTNNADSVIDDFSPTYKGPSSSDLIEISKSAFSLGDSTSFYVSSNTHSSGTTSQIFYDSQNGNLYADGDGTGSKPTYLVTNLTNKDGSHPFIQSSDLKII